MQRLAARFSARGFAQWRREATGTCGSNTYAIVNKAGGMLARGRGDELAVIAGLPQETYGFWAEQGATMIQTDEPEAAMAWLTANGYRVPYASEVRAGALSRAAEVAAGQ